jgi:DNA adenine methylase
MSFGGMNSNDSFFLPSVVRHVRAPPIKCQGIKTKSVNFIASNIKWKGDGRWVEPFLGSGAVLFNIAPERALASDLNGHIIEFYRSIQEHKTDHKIVRDFLEEEGKKLEAGDGEFYYEVRDRFNKNHDPLDLLFLSRACFNGVMRFNGKGEFNTPYNHKKNRFSPAYITKIVNQVRFVANVIEGKEWEFRKGDWKETLRGLSAGDFVYADPPYYGRHTDYYGTWMDYDDERLAHALGELEGGFALSSWKENEFRKNEQLDRHWSRFSIKVQSHFYHVGSVEDYRHPMTEALVIKPGFEANLLKESTDH